MYQDHPIDIFWPFTLALFGGSVIAAIFTGLWFLPLLALFAIGVLATSFGHILKSIREHGLEDMHLEGDDKNGRKDKPSRGRGVASSKPSNSRKRSGSS